MTHDPAEDGAGLVYEAAGPPMSALGAAGALGVGVNSLLALGVMPVLLGALAAEHRLTDAGIGIASAIEVLTMGLATALTGVLVKPRRLRAIGLVCSLALAGVDLASAGASGAGVYALRGAAGAIEGVLLWITIAMIARTLTPERWAGVFFTAQTFSQLLLALALAFWIMPALGAWGGFLAVAACALVGVIPALFAPDRLADLNPGEAVPGAPPPRGWIALAATLVVASGSGAVSVYLQPLAAQIGLGADVARTALWVSLAGQVAGAAAATALAGRVRWFHVFVGGTAVTLTVWWVVAQHVPAPIFIAAWGVGGLSTIFLAPFLTPMAIEADPSRRAAVQSGAAQLFGGAAGPALAAAVVSGQQVQGVLGLGAALTLLGLALMAWLHFSHREAMDS